MTFSLTWLPKVLEDAGLKVAEVPGWQERGRGDMGQILGVICHYTAGPRSGNMPSLNLLVKGRADLSGPLSQLGLGRDGTYYIIAAGRANHAGGGVWKGITNGNSNFIGIEAENTGRANDPWPEIQLDAYRRGVAAILKRVGRGAEFCCGHREYARPVGRKPDPNLQMDDFRSEVARLMEGEIARPLIPARESSPAGRPTLRRDARGEHVGAVQAKLGVVGPDVFGPKTEAAVREFQRRHDLVPDGIVGPKTWAALDALGATDIPPEPVTDESAPPPPVIGAASSDATLAWGSKVSPQFRDKVRSISADIGCAPDSLMACMAF